MGCVRTRLVYVRCPPLTGLLGLAQGRRHLDYLRTPSVWWWWRYNCVYIVFSSLVLQTEDAVILFFSVYKVLSLQVKASANASNNNIQPIPFSITFFRRIEMCSKHEYTAAAIFIFILYM